MDEKEFSMALEDILTELDEDDVLGVRWVSDWEGRMTHNTGLTIKLENGDEFELTIVQSKRGTNAS